MDLHGAVGDAARHLRGEQLAAGGVNRNDRAAIEPPCRLQHHAARGIGLGTAVGEHRLNELEFADRPAELLALRGVAGAVLDQARKSPRLNSSHQYASPMPPSA